MNTRITTRGFTLIEVIVYLALFSVIISGAMVGTYQIIEGSKLTQSHIYTQEEANFILQKIDWALSGVSAISVPAAGNSGSSLVITKADYAFNPIMLDSNGGSLRIKTGTGAFFELNNQAVIVANLNFEHKPSVGTRPESLRVIFTVDGNNFETIKYLRK